MEIELVVERGGERLDRYLAGCLPEVSRSRVQSLIGRGCVWVNEGRVAAKKTLVAEGDRIVVRLPEPEPIDLQPADIPLQVLYEDDEVVVVNKPAGMVVHPAPGHADGTLVNALLPRCQNGLASIGGELRPGIVHRLDKDTTGAIVVAKSDRALQHLQGQIQAKTARREYLGVVCGVPDRERGTVDAPVGRHLRDRKKMAIVPPEKGGRNATTHWQVRERLGNYTLLHFQLETGRTHQIRVHCSHMGHPIVGDRTYGRNRFSGVKLPGQALHAWRLTFQHPVTGEAIEAIAPLPEAFEKLLRWMRDRSNQAQF